jgi:hypothetical protein
LKIAHESGLLVLPDVLKPGGMPREDFGIEKPDQAISPYPRLARKIEVHLMLLSFDMLNSMYVSFSILTKRGDHVNF